MHQTGVGDSRWDCHYWVGGVGGGLLRGGVGYFGGGFRSLLCFLAGVHCHGHGIGLGLGHGMVGAMPMPMPSLSPCHDDAMAMAWPSTLGVFLRGPIVE